MACRFATYGLSAHADGMQVAAFIESMSPRAAVLVHGDRPAKEALAEHLGAKDISLAEDGDMLALRPHRCKNLG